MLLAGEEGKDGREKKEKEVVNSAGQPLGKKMTKTQERLLARDKKLVKTNEKMLKYV